MPRIVSLLASSTEILCALGFEPDLVGRSHESDFPESVRRLPVCTEPKFDVRLPSSVIDERVKSILEEALSVYRVDAERLRSLRPEVVVTQSQCEVCAVSLRDVEEALSQWLDTRPEVVSLQAESLDGVWDDMLRVAEVLGVSERGRQVVDRLRSRMREISTRAGSLRTRPSVACIEWIDPLMASGNWMPEIVQMAGGQNLFGKPGEHAPDLTWEEIQHADPQILVVLPCGFDLDRTRQEIPNLTARPGWADLRAVRDERTYLLDGNQFFNRSGPRLVESLEILAEILHPDVFRFGHEGTGWERLHESGGG